MRTTYIVLITLLCLLLLGFLYIFTGIFNPSALVPHTKLTLWVINKTRDNSVERRDRNIVVPALNDSALIVTGFEHYNEMCVICHSAPGIKPSEIARGLYPLPPLIYKYGSTMEPAEAFWIIKNGLKLTGMPAFGETHSDEKIWAITAFVTHKLENMTPEEFKEWQLKYQENEVMDDD